MTSRGETSRVRDDEFTDIPVDTEQLVGYEPVAPVQDDSEEDIQDDSDEPEEDPSEFIPESSAEVPAEGSPPANTFQNDLIAEYSQRIDEQEEEIEQKDARIAQLESELQVSRQMEDQLVDEAYQHEVDVAELKAKIQQLEQSQPSLGPTVQQLMLQNSHLRQDLEQADAHRASLQSAYHAMRTERDHERADRIFLEGAWNRATVRVNSLERQVRDGSAHIDSLEYALDTSFDRLRDRVRRYPRDSGHTRRSVRRRTVDRIARREHRLAVRRSRR